MQTTNATVGITADRIAALLDRLVCIEAKMLIQTQQINRLSRTVGLSHLPVSPEVLCFEVLNFVSRKSTLPVETITGKLRTNEVCLWRWIAMWLLRKYGGISSTHIGKALKRHRTDVFHALTRLPEYMDNDPKIANLVRQMESEWRSRSLCNPIQPCNNSQPQQSCSTCADIPCGECRKKST